MLSPLLDMRERETSSSKMEYSGNLCSYQFSSDWDLHNFEVFNNDFSLVTEPMSLDFSSGYLQDAVDEWINSFKRRRVSSPDSSSDQMTGFSEQTSYSSDDQEQGHPLENLSCLSKKALLPPENGDDHHGSKKVAYPFDMVKPGGMKGDVTLNEINERIMRRPKRSIRHPVGDMACKSCVLATGLGPSGKAVVAITRIHTRGRGTVTIVKTRG